MVGGTQDTGEPNHPGSLDLQDHICPVPHRVRIHSSAPGTGFMLNEHLWS